MTEIEAVSETDRYFFIQLTTGNALILPKRVLEDISAIETYMDALQITRRYFPDNAWIR